MHRLLLQITLRDIFWLTVVAALVVAWWIDHWRMDAHLRPWLEWERGGRRGSPPVTIVQEPLLLPK